MTRKQALAVAANMEQAGAGRLVARVKKDDHLGWVVLGSLPDGRDTVLIAHATTPPRLRGRPRKQVQS